MDTMEEQLLGDFISNTWRYLNICTCDILYISSLFLDYSGVSISSFLQWYWWKHTGFKTSPTGTSQAAYGAVMRGIHQSGKALHGPNWTSVFRILWLPATCQTDFISVRVWKCPACLSVCSRICLHPPCMIYTLYFCLFIINFTLRLTGWGHRWSWRFVGLDHSSGPACSSSSVSQCGAALLSCLSSFHCVATLFLSFFSLLIHVCSSPAAKHPDSAHVAHVMWRSLEKSCKSSTEQEDNITDKLLF